MRSSPVNLGKRTLKYGGKSGILPEVRPIFKRNPIKPKSEHQKHEEAQIEQGYAEGIPTPKKRGFVFHRKPVERPVITVEERIKKFIEDRAPDVDKSKLSQEELWELQRDEVRRQHLKDAFLAEAKRLERLEQLEAKKQEQEQKHKDQQEHFEESVATKLTLPTIDSYLKGPIMRHRTPEEQAIVNEKRTLNRKATELAVMESKATDLLNLYHAASTFITTEEELEVAIKDAFEVKVGKFESSERLIEDKLFGFHNSYNNAKTGEKLIQDAAFGEIDGQPGLDAVKETLSGEAESMRRDAQARLNHNN